MWLGIPFLYVKERLADTISIDKIPTVSLDSSFSWETIIAAFLSGLVPAIISLYVINESNKSVRYQQGQEDRRNYASHIRLNVSEYAYQLTKLKAIHTSWVRGGLHYSEHRMKEFEVKTNDALNELERYKVSLLISIPDNVDGLAFKKSINDISKDLTDVIRTHTETMASGMSWTGKYMSFISDANNYLNKLT